jgi:hypothetical protein
MKSAGIRQEYNAEIEKALIKMFKVAMDIDMNTEHPVFINVSGHVKSISLNVAASKELYITKIFSDDWIQYGLPDDDAYEEGMLFEGLESDKDTIIAGIEMTIARLKSAIQNNNIEYIHVSPEDAMRAEVPLFVLKDDKYVQVDIESFGPNAYYDVEGNKYTEVYINKGLSNG